MDDLVRHERHEGKSVPGGADRDGLAPPDDEDEAEVAALLAALAAGDLGDATEEFDLTTLTPAERAALSRMLRSRLEGAAADDGSAPQ